MSKHLICVSAASLLLVFVSFPWLPAPARGGGFETKTVSLKKDVDVVLIDSTFNSRFNVLISIDPEYSNFLNSVEINAPADAIVDNELLVEQRGKTLLIEPLFPIGMAIERTVVVKIFLGRLKYFKSVGANTVRIFGLNEKVFECLLDGTGKVFLIGNAKSASISIKGNLRIDASEFLAEDLQIYATDYTRSLVRPRRQIEAVAKKSAEIYFLRAPTAERLFEAFDGAFIKAVSSPGDAILSEKEASKR